eukprot:3937718-Amphidinium_carterae.1
MKWYVSTLATCARGGMLTGKYIDEPAAVDQPPPQMMGRSMMPRGRIHQHFDLRPTLIFKSALWGS